MAVTKEYRTTMYSIRLTKEGEEEVVVHKFPFNANQKEGREKLQKMVKRGFSFQDPRIKGGDGQPEVTVTNQVNLDKPGLLVALCKDCLTDGREVLVEDCNFHKEG